MCFSHKCERVQEDRHQLGTAKDGMIVDNISNSEKEYVCWDKAVKILDSICGGRFMLIEPGQAIVLPINITD